MEPEYTEIDLSPSRVRGFLGGLRPFRQGNPRLEIEEIGQGKVVAHNYGHGGSGITMSWGAARAAADLLDPWLVEPTEVAVLGAGVIGLCTASTLLDRGHRVRLYARDFPPDTTSNVAGGLWAPTHVGCGQDAVALERHNTLLRQTWEAYRSLDGDRFGIEEIPLYEADDRSDPLDPMPEGLVPSPTRLERLPFPGQGVAGRVSQTLLIETPRFLSALVSDIEQRGASLHSRSFAGSKDFEALSERVVVNCLGFGAGEVCADDAIVPIRGQLVILDPAPRPFALDHALGYVISRRDVLILGGTFEEGEKDPRPQEKDCLRILNRHREFFGC